MQYNITNDALDALANIMNYISEVTGRKIPPPYTNGRNTVGMIDGFRSFRYNLLTAYSPDIICNYKEAFDIALKICEIALADLAAIEAATRA